MTSEHLRSGRLPLQRFVQFASKPSDLRLLATSGDELERASDLRRIAAFRLWPSFDVAL